MSRAVNDITGQVFGLLTVKEAGGKCSNGQMKWKCICACGREVIVRGYDLRKGNTSSCGNVGCKAQGKNTLKKDCFAYVTRNNKHFCSAMAEVLCLSGKCKFYAPIQEVCGKCEKKKCASCLTVSHKKQNEILKDCDDL